MGKFARSFVVIAKTRSVSSDEHSSNRGVAMLRSYDDYLDDLESAPVVADHARSDKLWVKDEHLSDTDLRVLLCAARNVVHHIKSEM